MFDSLLSTWRISEELCYTNLHAINWRRVVLLRKPSHKDKFSQSDGVYGCWSEIWFPERAIPVTGFIHSSGSISINMYLMPTLGQALPLAWGHRGEQLDTFLSLRSSWSGERLLQDTLANKWIMQLQIARIIWRELRVIEWQRVIGEWEWELISIGFSKRAALRRWHLSKDTCGHHLRICLLQLTPRAAISSPEDVLCWSCISGGQVFLFFQGLCSIDPYLLKPGCWPSGTGAIYRLLKSESVFSVAPIKSYFHDFLGWGWESSIPSIWLC